MSDTDEFDPFVWLLVLVGGLALASLVPAGVWLGLTWPQAFGAVFVGGIGAHVTNGAYEAPRS